MAPKSTIKLWTQQFVEERIGKCFLDLGIGKDFMEKAQIALAIKRKQNDKLDFVKQKKSSTFQKNTVRE